MYVNIEETKKCSKCESALSERVTRREYSFDRCRNCGHEGKKDHLRSTDDQSNRTWRIASDGQPRTKTF